GNFVLDSFVVDGGELDVFETREGDTSFGALFSKLSKRRNRSQLALEGVSINTIQLSDCAVRFRWEERPDALVAFRGLNLDCNDFRPGTDCSVTLDSSLDLVSDESAAISLQAKGTIDFNLKETGLPKMADGLLALSFGAGSGRLDELSEAQGEMKLAIQPEEVGDSGLRLFRGNEDLGSIMVNGPFDSNRMEGRLSIKTTPLKRPILNLVATVSGLDFGGTTLSSDMTVDWAFGGSMVSARGKIEASNLEVLKGEARTPKTAFFGEYAFQYNQDDGSLLFQKCQFQASSGGVDWLTGNLGSPVILSWGDARPGIKEPDFDLRVKDFDMKAWASFFQIELPPGALSFDAATSIQRDGRLIISKVHGDFKGLEFPTPIGRPVVTDLEFEFAARLEEMKRLSVVDATYHCLEDGSDLLNGTGVFSIRFDDASYNLQVVSRGPVSRMSELSGIAGLDLVRGDFDATIRVLGKGDSYDIVVSTGLSDLEGHYSEMVFEDHRLESKLDAKMTGGQIQLNNFSVQLRKSYTDAGSIRFNGGYDLDTETGNVQFQSVGINRHLFGALLDSRIQTERLGEAELKLEGQLDLNRNRVTRVEGKIGVSQLSYLLDDGEATTPFGIEVAGEAEISAEWLKVGEGSVQLTKMVRGDNLVKFEAEVPLSSNGNQNGAIKVVGDSVDLSGFWNWYQWIRTEPNEPALVIERDDAGSFDSASEESENSGVVEVDLALDEFYLLDLEVRDLALKSTHGKGLFIIDGVTAEVNDGSIEGRVAASQKGGATDVSVDLSVSKLPIHHILSILAVPDREPMSGELTAQVLLDGRIGNDDGEKTALSGHIKGVLREPVFPSSDSGQSPWLTPVLGALRLPSIENVHFDRVFASVQLDGEVAEVEDLSLDGDLLKLMSSGKVSLVNNVGETRLELPVDVLIEEGVGSKSGLPLNLNGSIPGFGLLPSFLSIQGDLGDPRFEVDRIALTKILIESVANGLPVAPAEESSESK
ncbi:AsmA-like C-terminal region-containing protein, partial [Verrucomicrobia bacterium]|nr:AsmA-like C-terminal region-containing protein [Verrucomicrobiota bacterium]